MADEPKPPPNPDDAPRRGRKPKLIPEMVDAAVILVLDGNYRADVARAIGVTPSTFSHWMKAGLEFPDGIYGNLRQAVLKAEGEFKTRAVGEIVSAGKGDPWLMLAILERKYPKQFGKFRGELGEMKRRVKQLERLMAQLERDCESADPQPV